MRTWVQSQIKSCSVILESHHWGGRQEDAGRLLATYCSAIIKLHIQWGTSSQKLRWKETTTQRFCYRTTTAFNTVIKAGSKDISICPYVWNQEPHTSSVWITAVTSGNCQAWLIPVPQKTNSLQFLRSSWIPMWSIFPSDSLYSSNFCL